MIMFMIWILSALLIVISQTLLSDAALIYGKVGGSIVLNPAQISETIKSATWKHNTDLAVDWFGQEIICHRTFEGRCGFDKRSGSLTINSLTLEDSGSYTVEINNKVLEKKELQVITDLIYGKVGGSIILNPGQISEPIETVKWRYKAELASKGSWQNIQKDNVFKGRCDFDKTSGSLTINSLTLEDSGSYIVEINNKVLEKKELQVITDLIYGKVGGSIILNPGQNSEPIEKLKWRYKSNSALLKFWKDIDHKSFQGRCDFNKTSGSLTINSLTLKDSGSYKLENNKVLEMKELQVIKPVPKPSVSIKYNHEKDSWSLTSNVPSSSSPLSSTIGGLYPLDPQGSPPLQLSSTSEQVYPRTSENLQDPPASETLPSSRDSPLSPAPRDPASPPAPRHSASPPAPLPATRDFDFPPPTL
ncbi:PREDICTED: uncharacterized protein LOC107086649, partial [Cyprinodon variegatus]|uniref:uncharacterized protein LOC107086649 n=1 Tax=Cyprinodon variegatus TaxID=28743 RepID=UPI00074276DB